MRRFGGFASSSFLLTHQQGIENGRKIKLNGFVLG